MYETVLAHSTINWGGEEEIVLEEGAKTLVGREGTS